MKRLGAISAVGRLAIPRPRSSAAPFGRLGVALLLAAAGCAADTTNNPGGGSAGGDPNLAAGSGGAIGGPITTGTGGTGFESPMGAGGSGIVGTGTGGAGTDTGTGGTSSVGPVDSMHGTPLPCGVSKVVAANCGSCHGATPMGGAPMPLVTYEDFQSQHTVQFYMPLKGQTLKVADIVKQRINDKASPMPPGGNMPTADLDMLNTWLDAGAAAGTAADANCDGGTMMPPPMMMNADPLCAPQPGEQETCYELQTHGGQTPGDTTKYTIDSGEHYEQFYYKVPWPSGVQGTRFGAVYDNVAVLHHWLLFTTARDQSFDGQHETVIGTQIGDSSALIAGWAVGGRDVCLPTSIGFKLPDNGSMLNLQWHFYNSTGQPQQDGTKVLVCTVPAGTRPNTAGITWLGTENLAMAPGQSADKTGSCINTTSDPIHIWAFWPHMHFLGRNMKATVRHTDGSEDVVFNKPFDFNKQVHYVQDPEVVLQPGETIISTCSFDNNTDQYVDFGPSTNEEMCYNFAFSYPAGALDNGVPSLIGATNTCWQFGE